MTANGCLLLICGLPAIGKSRLANSLVHRSITIGSNVYHSPDNNNNFFTFKISVDDLMSVKDQSFHIHLNGIWRQFRRNIVIATKLFVRKLTQNDQLLTHEDTEDVMTLLDIIYECNQTVINQWRRQTTSADNKKFVIIIDDNLYYKSMRYEWYQTCKELSLGFAIIMINTSLELSLNGNRLRDEDKRLPDDVIVRMSERFECPQPSAEPFEQKTYFLRADTTIDHKIDDSLIEFITDAIGEPVVDQTIRLPIEEQLRQRLNTESKNNVIHKIDCLLRQLVGELVNKSSDKKSCAKVLNSSKKCLLHDLKQSPSFLSQTIAKQLVSDCDDCSVNGLHFSDDIRQCFTKLLLDIY